MTTSLMIRYRTHSDRADENHRSVEAVFAELAAAAPPGLRYLTLRLPDATFVHVVTYDAGTDPSALTQLPAFQAFQAGVRERCVEPPVRTEATVVGSYRMVAE
jgi:hypothetical protein